MDSHRKNLAEVETSRAEALVRKKMENIYGRSVPLKVRLSWGVNWTEAK